MLLKTYSVLTVLVLQDFYARLANCVKTSIYKNIEDDMKRLKANSVQCSKADFDDILRIKCEGNTQKAMLCITERLLVNEGKNDGYLWTLLGDLYQTLGKTNKANKCYKRAAKLDGKFPGQISLWHVLGPFQIGKNEVDGDPLQSIGGIAKLHCQKYNKKFRAHSELVSGGDVSWRTIRPDNNGYITMTADTYPLVYGLFSYAVMEWQAWFVGDFMLNSEMSLLVQCGGVSTIYIDDHILTGDVYTSRRYYWHAVHLFPGVHSLRLRTRAVGKVTFTCRITPADQAPSFQIHTPVTPDLLDGRIFSNLMAIPVTNHNAENWLTITKLSISQESGPTITVHLQKQKKLIIAPGQIYPIIATFHLKKTNENEKSCPLEDIRGRLELKSNEGRKQDVPFIIRCRPKEMSFLFTFIDHDGSVQKAAAIFPPVIGKKKDYPQKHPVLLTLHGTGVSPQDQADAYKRMEKGKWLFGAERLWILAPTRHGAHNWEGPGDLTAMTSLKRLAELTLEHDWIMAKANDKAVVFAGHSMGGHGAWQLSMHHPDIALAVVSIAGWICKENYGDSNTFFKYDISLSYVDASVKHVMESCVIENDAEKHMSNLKGVPVMIRIGEKDETVSPYFSRRMYRLLTEQGNDVTYNELPDKQHWWWDTYEENDGGVVNDGKMRKFFSKHSSFAIRRVSTQACVGDEHDKKGCKIDGSMYSSKNIPNRNDEKEFLLTVYNPASIQGVRGVQVLQQAIPFRKTTVHIKLSDDNATLVTSNAIRLRLSEPAISAVLWKTRQIIVDSVILSFSQNDEKHVDICKKEIRDWKICEDSGKTLESEVSRGPLNLGPARRIAERPLIIAVGASKQGKDVSQALLQMAVYVGNTFYLTSDLSPVILRYHEITEENTHNRNVIIIGDLSLTKGYLKKVSLHVTEDRSISLGNCWFEWSNMGILSLVPLSGSRLGMIITGTSLSSIRDVISLATPTIPPMARSPFSNLVPDYVITGPDFKAKGPGGYLCAGFWGNRWEYRSELSSCAC